MVVSLGTEDKRPDEYRGGDGERTAEVLGVTVPEVLIAVLPGRDVANIVEAAALNMKLKRLGHDAEKELDEKLVSLLTGGQGAD